MTGGLGLGAEDMTDRNLRSWFWLAIGVSVLSALWTLFLAGIANEIWEEAHFRVAGQQAEWGYPDTPAGAPLWAAWSSAIFGETRLGPRALSWLVSSLFPLAVWFLAAAVTTPRHALIAAALGAIIPVFVVTGAFAYPEAPMQTLVVAFMGFLVRATRSDRLHWWIGAGVICALGVAYYYRFWFAPFGVLIFLIATAQGRALWARRNAWIGGALALLGLAPSLIDNMLEDWRPILFHLAGRQDWAFWPRGALYPLEQAMLATPVIFAFILGGAWIAYGRWRARSDAAAALILITAGVLSLPYFLIAFFDKDYLLHWPILAWALLLVYTPQAMARFVTVMSGRGWRLPSLAVVALAPVLALGGAVANGTMLVLWRYPAPLIEAGRQDLLVGGDFEDWSVLRPALEQAFADAGPDAVLIGGDHTTTARIQTAARLTQPVVVLDHPEDRSRSFQLYRRMRGEGEAELADYAGRSAVIVLREPSYLYREIERVEMRERLCAALSHAVMVEQIVLEPGRKRASIFLARVRAGEETGLVPGACPLLPFGVIEQPVAGESVPKAVINVYGPAAHPDGVAQVTVRLDGDEIAAITTLNDLPGYRFPDTLSFDPAYPNVFWGARPDLSAYEAGRYEMSLSIVTGAGEEVLLETRPIFIR